MPKISEYIKANRSITEGVRTAEILSGTDSLDLERAQRLRAAIEVAAESFDDSEAVNWPELYQKWASGVAYETGTRVQYDGALYKVLQDHTSQETWTPTDSPSLFSAILPGQDGTDIGEWVQPDSTNPYAKGDRVTHNGKTWESLVDNNVWEPGATGTETLWTEVTE